MRLVVTTVFFLIGTICASNSFSGDIISVEGKGDSLCISSTSKPILERSIQALLKWSHNLGKKVDPKSAVIDVTPNGFKASICDIVPPFVRSTHGLELQDHGPNCFGTSLHMNKIIPAARMAEDEEMEFWLNSPICREISNGEELTAGDIGVFRVWENELKSDGTLLGKSYVQTDHAFIHVSEDLVFNKWGIAKDFPFELLSSSSLFNGGMAGGPPSIPQKCRGVIGASQECEVWINYYRCYPLSKYIDDHREKISEDYFEIARILNEIERDYENASFYGGEHYKKLLSHDEKILVSFIESLFKKQIPVEILSDYSYKENLEILRSIYKEDEVMSFLAESQFHAIWSLGEHSFVIEGVQLWHEEEVPQEPKDK